MDHMGSQEPKAPMPVIDPEFEANDSLKFRFQGPI